MTAFEIVCLSVVVLWCVAILTIVGLAKKRARFDEYRYRLFAVRDQLFWLVASGELDEESVVFQETSRLINGTIRHVERFTLGAFMEALEEADRNSLSDHDRLEIWMKEVLNSPLSVQKVVVDYYLTSRAILRENSSLLQIILAFRRTLRADGAHLRTALEPFIPDVYRAYRLLQGRLSALEDKGIPVPRAA